MEIKTTYSIEEEHKEIYLIFQEKKSFFKEHADVFLLAAVLGYSIERREVIEKKLPLIKHNVLFDEERRKVIYQSFDIIAKKNNEITSEIIEEYAKGGILELKKYIDNHSKAFLESNFLTHIAQEIVTRSF